MKTKFFPSLVLASALLSSPAFAAEYLIDTKGAHASIQFRISHLGTSWLLGRFNNFSGNFSYDPAKPEAAKVSVDIDVTSIDSNHAERDKHLKSDDYLNVKDMPSAKFVSTAYLPGSAENGIMQGTLELNGVKKPIEINVTKVGEGEDPWGGYRAGFSGTTELKLKDFGYTFNLGPAAETVYLDLNIEGIRQD